MNAKGNREVKMMFEEVSCVGDIEYEIDAANQNPFAYSNPKTVTVTARRENIPKRIKLQGATQTIESDSTTHHILNQILNELKSLRNDIRDLQNREMQNTTEVLYEETTTQLNIPADSAYAFQNLEIEIQTNDCSVKALESIFNKIPDQSLEKYIRGCLKAVVTDEAASNFSWYGKNNNIKVQSFLIMNIIKDTANTKFPTASENDILNILKKWFHYAKDRARKSIKKF